MTTSLCGIHRSSANVVTPVNGPDWGWGNYSAARPWLGRYVTEEKAVSLLKAQLALVALSELRAGEREATAKLLTELVRR
jgi:hypothetical protein